MISSVSIRIAALLLILLGSIPAYSQIVFKAGFASIDVTPTAPMPMWGYGARSDLLSQGVRDPLYAKVLVIEADGAKVALVGLDLGRSPGDPEYQRILDAVGKQAGVDYVMMSGSHTHHGPVLELKDEEGKGKGKFDAGVAYRAELEKKLIQVIVEAAGNAKDARIGWTSKDLDMNRNRHSKLASKPRDTELSVIRLDGIDGKPIAVMVNYSAHPTILNGADLRFSAEFPGVMMDVVEETLNAPCFFMQGAAGDLSVKTLPVDIMPADDPSLLPSRLSVEQREMIMEIQKATEADAIKLQQSMIRDEARMVSYGTRLANEVITLAKAVKTTRPDNPSVQGMTKEFEYETRVNFQSSFVQGMFRQAFFAELANASLDDVKENLITTRLSVVVINNALALVGGSGEFFCNHANRLKDRSGAEKTLFFGYCNGHQMYFPTIEGASQGGYGADPEVSWVALGAGEEMMDEALIAIYEFMGRLTRVPLGGAPAKKN